MHPFILYIVGPNILFCIEVVSVAKATLESPLSVRESVLTLVNHDLISFQHTVATISLFGLFSVHVQIFNFSHAVQVENSAFGFCYFLHNPTCSLFIVKHLVWKRYKIYEFKKQSDIKF